MKPAHSLAILAAALFLYSCAGDRGSTAHDTAAEAGQSSTTTVDAAADSAGMPLALTDPARKILRTADLRCRVRDVYAAASALESTVRGVGGIIAESRLATDETSSEEIAHGEDSLKEIRTFVTTAHLTLRVPVASLDSVVRLVPQGALFLHRRTLAQEDATLRYLSAELKNRATDHTDAALAKARRTADVIAATEYEDARADRRVDRRIETLDIADRAAYATLTVEYYQPQSVDVQVVVNPAASTRTPLGGRVAGALHTGWRAMEGLLVAVVALWPLWLLAAGGWLLYRTYRRGAPRRSATFARSIQP